MCKDYPFIVIAKKRSHCQAYRCKGKKDKSGKFCAKHYKRLRKFRDPVAYAYSVTKCNARRRGKSFDLTLEEWRQFCEDTRYVELKGRTAASASIDREDNRLGYTLSNIRVISLSENSRKAAAECGF